MKTSITTQQITVADIDKSLITPENKCSFCKASYCCTYATQEIDAPRSKADYMNLLWQVSHEHVSIFQDEHGWFLLIDGKCSHLQADGLCGIYENRPPACREHSNDYCEFDSPLMEGFEHYFPTYESLLKHCKKKFKNWDGKSAKKKKAKQKKK